MAVDERGIFVVVLAVLLVGSGVAGIVFDGRAAGPAPVAPAGNDTDYQVTQEGVRYTVPPGDIRQGCPGGMDCIPSIDDPAYQSPSEATWLSEGELVIGVEIDGEAKAYPLRILAVHEIVNDRIGGKPVAVTYCPLCRSGIVFSRDVGEETVTFGVSGKLLDANLIMYDRQTETYWSQIRGEAVVGELVPTRLDQFPSSITTWEQWRGAHPKTQVLSRNTGVYPASTYSSNPYSGYANRSGVGFGVGEVDGRLPEKDIVYGIAVGDEARAYPADAVRERGVVNDEVGGMPVLVFEAADGDIRLFRRQVDNETLTFDRVDGTLVDQHGHRWSDGGEALDGPRAGETLDRRPTHGIYWFAWSSFHPNTTVYGRTASA